MKDDPRTAESLLTGHPSAFRLHPSGTAAIAGLLLLSVLAGAACAQYPVRPLRLIVPYPAGGNGDVVARIVTAEMAKGLGQHIVVEIRPGAGGTIGADAVAKATPDGYTLLLMTGGHAVAEASYKSLPYRTPDSFATISTVTVFPFVLVARADGYPALPALLRAAKAAPGTVRFGAAGPGATQHLTGELLSSMAGAKLLYVPYKGDAPAVTALLSSEVHFIIAPAAPVLPHVQSGRFKLLATTGPERWKGAPELPTVAESGVPGFEVISWVGFVTTAGAPRAAVKRLHDEIQRSLQVRDIAAKLDQIGGEARASSPEDLRARVANEVQRWSRVIREAGINPQ
jgi:tripartite-type tricarboxylate transporter receptor subunit TctC